MEQNQQLSELNAIQIEDDYFRVALNWIIENHGHPESTQNSSPVFLLAAGWCSGSITLIEMLRQHCLIWGEPYGQGNLLQPMKRQLIAIHDALRNESSESIYVSKAWLESQALFFLNLFERPAHEAGAYNWGVSEVRWTLSDAMFLRFLFPNAKFLLLIRNPFDAFREYFETKQIWEIFPGISLTVSAFGRHWARLTNDFRQHAEEICAKVLFYEDLRDPRTVRELCTYLGIEKCLESSLAEAKRSRHVPLPHWKELDRHVGKIAQPLGYELTDKENFSGIGPYNSKALTVEKSLENSSCVVLVRVREQIDPMCEESLKILEQRGFVVKRIYGFSAVDVGRCIMAYEALTEGFSELFWIDSRVVFHPDAVNQLRTHGLPLVSCAVPRTATKGFELDFLDEPEVVTFGEDGGLVEVLRTGCSFLYTHRQVYEKIYQQLELPLCNQQMAQGLGFLPFFQPMVCDSDSNIPLYLAEDFAFSERARKCGIPIIVDTSIRVGHVGTYPYMWEDIAMARQFSKSFSWNVGEGKLKQFDT